ncbi:MAG: ATP-binding protein [Myxococcales bacterium]|jgi:two-component system NtrC family sensor kinase
MWRRRRAGSGTARRLFLAFSLLIGVFGVASWFALSGLAEVHASIAAMREREEGVRLALELASAVRDQYAHQAHTIIIGDESHMVMYSESYGHVLSLANRVRDRVQTKEELARVAEIERASGELDDIFREQIVPAVLSGDFQHVQLEHDRAQMVVGHIQTQVDHLVAAFEVAIRELEANAAQVQRSTYRTTVASLLAMLGLAIGIGLYIARSIAVPVARLSEGAARLAGGDLDTRLDDRSPDEFGDLARQFNAMTAALKENQQKLVETEKLVGIGRLAAGVAHEINNPLGVILGYTRLLGKKAEGTLAEDLKVIEDETLRCKEIVEGLLDLSRSVRTPPQPVDLRELCDETVERLREARPMDCVEIRVDGVGQLEGHPQKLRQVLFNLLKNAGEAVGEKGTIEIDIRTREGCGEGCVEVAISDSGPGIAPEIRARLFEPFFTTKAGGTGLGLAVSQAIARAHGGRIEAEEAASGGACFRLTLPKATHVGCEELTQNG